MPKLSPLARDIASVAASTPAARHAVLLADPKRLVNRDGAAEVVEVSPQSITAFAASGRLRVAKRIGRQTMYRVGDLLKLRKQREGSK